MKVSVFGLGYVGCVTSACFARDGHDVIGVDVNAQKVEQINAGLAPIIEPGLAPVLAEVSRQGRLRATLDAHVAVEQSDASLICVGTPSRSNGCLDLQFVEKVCRDIGEALAARSAYHVVVLRSTVLPGTIERTVVPLLNRCSRKRAGSDYGVCMNPEFLREGSAIEDYDRPSHILIGQADARSGDVVEKLYENVNGAVVRTTIKTAEMVKYVSNAFHAVKVAFSNEIGNLCKVHGIDGQEVMEIFCQDRRLSVSPAYLRPGFAFGGSCLPKDLRALLYDARANDLDLSLLRAVTESNQRQIARGIDMVERTGCKKVGVLGLSFKANTDDVRESPIIPLVETLIGRGYELTIYDEKVKPERLVGANKSFLDRALPHIASLMRSTIDEVIARSEVVVIANGAAAFRQVPRMLREGQKLIDLVGSARSDATVPDNYDGICW